MERSDFRLRSILLAIDEKLTNNERQRLCFLIGCEDVPRRLLDIVAKDSSAPMTDIWQTLFDRRMITNNNVNYLTERLVKIERLDLAQLLRNYCPISFSLSTTPSAETRNQVEQRANIPELFIRIDPDNT
jgi:hypothetical protein